MKREGSFRRAAIFVIEMEEVFDEIVASFASRGSSSLKIVAFREKLSLTASTT